MKTPTNRLFSRLFSLSFSLLAGCLTAFPVYSAPNYVASVIEFGEQYQDVTTAELNGDGLLDIIVSNWNETQGRELWLYLQQSDGKFPARASQKIEIKRDIIAFAIADIRQEPGEEFLFFTVSSVFSYSTQHPSYSNNLHKEADWLFINAVPTQRATYFLGRHQSTNNEIAILAPGPQQYGLFQFPLGGKTDADTNKPALPFIVPKAQRELLTSQNDTEVSVNFDDGLQFEVGKPSNFENYLVKRLETGNPEVSDFIARYQDVDSLLDFEQWVNKVHAGRFLSQDQTSLIYIDFDKSKNDNSPDKSQRVTLVDPLAKNNAIHWQGNLSPKDDVQFIDLNNDKLDDLLTLDIRGSDDISVNLYINRNGQFNFDQADQVLKFSGYDASFSVNDINNDGYSDLVVGTYQFSALNALREGAVVRIASIYLGNAEFSPTATTEQTPFLRRPDFRLEENFGADDFKSLAQPASFATDLNGDNIKDMVSIDDRGALVGKTLNPRLQLQSETDFDFVPLHFIQGFETHTLNADKQNDFVLRHQNALTILVSQ